MISTILITMEMELTALASPKSPFKSAVKAGAADAIGLRAGLPEPDGIPEEEA